MLADDPLFHELCDAFDELLAPMESALDCFAAYLDPRLAPPDFVDWLGLLVGAQAEPSWPVERRRAHLTEAVASNRLRGTAEGLRREVAAAASVPREQVTVEDPGGVTYSTRAVDRTDHAHRADAADRTDATAAPPPSLPVVVVRVLLPKAPAPASARRSRAADRTYGASEAAEDLAATTSVTTTPAAATPGAARASTTAAAVTSSTRRTSATPNRGELVAALVHEAVERARPVHCQVRIELGES